MWTLRLCPLTDNSIVVFSYYEVLLLASRPCSSLFWHCVGSFYSLQHAYMGFFHFCSICCSPLFTISLTNDFLQEFGVLDIDHSRQEALSSGGVSCLAGY